MNSADVDAIHCSLLVAGAATLVVVPIGTAIALGLVTAQRASRFWQVAGGIGQWLVDFPLVLPPVVTGYALLICFSPNHWPGEFLASCLGLRLLFHWSGAAVAAGVISLPLYVRAAQIGLERIPRSLEEMASLEGAGRWQIFRRISLPIAFPAMTLGTLL
ncbi:MAG: ABC transporter permease subunit, partial [Planctomycetota bacterium]